MLEHPVPAPVQGYPVAIGRRRRVRYEIAREARAVTQEEEGLQQREAWVPKWRKLVKDARDAPADFTEFDRTVRAMLNRISTENARRLLPLDPSLWGSEKSVGGDCPRWWATRFASLMLRSYLQVIHTNRFARGLAVRSADNVLPEYLDAVAPLLSQSPRLVTALMAWFAKQLDWHEYSWPTTRLVLLAAREERNRDMLPSHSLGRLPSEVLSGRILAFLRPPQLSAAATIEGDNLFCGSSLSNLIQEASPETSSDVDAKVEEDRKKDVVAVLVHVIVFAPLALWPRLSAFAFSLVEACLGTLGCYEEVHLQTYVAASVLAAIAQRIESKISMSNNEEMRRHCLEDLGPLSRLASTLQGVTSKSSMAARFIESRMVVALEHVRRVEEALQS